MIETLAPVRIGPEGKPAQTLGWEVLRWASDWLEQPDGPDAGTPWRATHEQVRFLAWWYAIDHAGRFVYRSGVLRRMKGWGKDPIAAVICAAEFVGPCRFKAWKRDGTPEVVPHPAAWVQLAAVSKEQTRNTMTLFPGLLSKRAIAEYGIDLGKEIIYAHGGRARIEAVTSSPRALEGGRSTLTIQNEPQHWLEANEGHAMAAVIARNAGKSRDGSSRVLSINNAHRIGEDSVAEREWEAYRKRPEGILYDSLEAPAALTDPAPGTDATAAPWPPPAEAVREALVLARGDSVWLDVDRITAEILDPRTSEADARRFYFNQLRAEASGWLSAAEWEACARDEDVPAGTLIALGFDGAHYRDATALVATTIEGGYQWPLAVWERPELAAEGWEVPVDEVKAAMREAFTRFDVFRLCADPWGWEDTLSGLHAEYGEKVVFWRANLLGPMARLVKEYETAVRGRSLGHARDPVMARHVANCVKRPTGLRDENGEFAYVISKDGPNSPRKIDLAMAALLSWRARLDAIAAGAIGAGRSALDDPNYAMTVLN